MAGPMFMRVGEGKSIDLPEFWRATGNFLGLLQEVDSSVAAKKTGNLRWKLTTLQIDPSPLIGVTPLMSRRATDDTSSAVEREIVGNISSLTERGERNRFLSDAALLRVEKIAKTTPKIGPSSIYVAESVNLITTVNTKTLHQVHDLTNPRSTSFGTITGILDTISVHKGLEFRVWDEESNRPVRCFLSDARQSQAMEFLGVRVLVTGMVNGDRYGRPLSVIVETFDPTAVPSEIPTIGKMRGFIPDFTGGLSLKEFLEDCY